MSPFRGSAIVSGLVIVALVHPGAAQTASRRLATIDALRQFPGFYHLQNVLLRGEFVDDGTRISLRSETGELRVVLENGAGTAPGLVDVRGQVIDVGRLEPGDPRLGAYLAGRDEQERWPRPGEELLLRVSSVAPAEPSTTPSIRALALEPWKFIGQKVTVVGNFRGRNLFGDLPGAPGASPHDFVVRSADAAIWVTGLRPRGRGFDLDVDRRIDSDRWVEVSGTVVHDRGLVRIEAARIVLAQAPPPPEPEPVPAAVALQPSEVVFSAPTQDEAGVSPTTTVRIQFSRGLRASTLEGRVRATYRDPGAEGRPLAFKTSYDPAARAVEIRFSEPLERFSAVRVDILEGVEAFDGAPVIPWSLVFSVGG